MKIALFFVGYFLVFGVFCYICMYEDLKDPEFRKGLWNGQKDE